MKSIQKTILQKRVLTKVMTLTKTHSLQHTHILLKFLYTFLDMLDNPYMLSDFGTIANFK